MSLVGIKISKISVSERPNSVHVMRLHNLLVAKRPKRSSNKSKRSSIILIFSVNYKSRKKRRKTKFNFPNVIKREKNYLPSTETLVGNSIKHSGTLNRSR